MPRRGPDPGVGVLYLVMLPVFASILTISSLPKRQNVPVVPGIGNHVVHVGTGNLVRLEDLELAGTDVEAQDGVRPGILQPDFAVHVVSIGADLIDLDVIAVQFRRQAPHLELLRLLVEFRDASLELQAQPQVLVFIEPQGEDARRRSGFSSGTWYSVTFPVRGSSLARICSPKLAYHTIPAESTITSCGCLVFGDKSYSV